MTMYNPPHPGEFIKDVYLAPLNVSPRSVAIKLHVSPSTFHAYSIVKVLSAQKWPYVYLNVLVELLKVGLQCKTTIIYGMQRRN